MMMMIMMMMLVNLLYTVQFREAVTSRLKCFDMAECGWQTVICPFMVYRPIPKI